MAWQVSAVILARLLRTGQSEEVEMSPCQASLLRLEGQGQEGRRAAPREGLSPAGLHLQSPLLQPPLMFLTDSYLPAAGHAPRQPAADKMLM